MKCDRNCLECKFERCLEEEPPEQEPEKTLTKRQASSKAWYERNKEKKKAQSRQWYWDNKPQIQNKRNKFKIGGKK